jgi:thiol-disulfide isomerase/thioredoxin
VRRFFAARARVLALMGIAGVATIVAVGVVVARDRGPAAPSAKRHTGGPGLSLEGTNPVTGEAVSLARFAGKPVVVTIWASWCPGCNAEAADLKRFVEAHPEAAFLGIDFQDSRGAARGFYRRYGWSFPSIFDPEGKIAFRLGLQGTPTTIFLDRRHREVARIVGETDESGLADGLRRADAS